VRAKPRITTQRLLQPRIVAFGSRGRCLLAISPAIENIMLISDSDSDQDQERGVARHRPERVSRQMLDHRVGDLDEPVDGVERERRRDAVPVRVLDLGCIDVDPRAPAADHGALHVVPAAQDTEGLRRYLRMISSMAVSSSLDRCGSSD